MSEKTLPPMVRDRIEVDRIEADGELYYILPSGFPGKFILVCETPTVMNLAHIVQENVDGFLDHAKPKAKH